MIAFWIRRLRRSAATSSAQSESLNRAAADSARVAAQIGRDHAIAAAQRLERLEPVQPAAGDPAVQQHHGGHVARPARRPHEQCAALGQVREVAGRRGSPADELDQMGESPLLTMRYGGCGQSGVCDFLEERLGGPTIGVGFGRGRVLSRSHHRRSRDATQEFPWRSDDPSPAPAPGASRAYSRAMAATLYLAGSIFILLVAASPAGSRRAGSGRWFRCISSAAGSRASSRSR